MRQPAGFTLAECAVAMAVLSAVVATASVGLTKLESVQAEFDAKALALDLVENALARATAELAAGANPARAPRPCGAAAEPLLPGASMRVDAQPSVTTGLTRLVAVIEWQGPHGTGKRQVTLVAWARPRQGATP